MSNRVELKWRENKQLSYETYCNYAIDIEAILNKLDRLHGIKITDIVVTWYENEARPAADSLSE